ncbi:penicillin-binding protein 2 [bacterium BMS3Bbin04]|nr:penicillin-binding protein 2 [bacterium BMS3Bbin04]
MTAQRLADELGISERAVAAKLESGASLIRIARQVLPSTTNRIEAMNLPGVEIVRQTKRSYPYGSTASQVLGHVNVDNVGNAGIEKLYQKTLAGHPGQAVMQMDARGSSRFDPDYPREEPLHGGRVTLAIDIDAQAIAEEELAVGIAANEATGGMVVITRPQTGEVLAIASWPDYDPNNPSEGPVENQKNRAITDVYEPGSTFKIVTFTAVLERDLINLDEMIDLEEGRWHVADRIIRDSHRNDSLSVRQGFAKSSNILTGKLAERMSKSEFYTVMRDFGFGQKTGIDFIGEVRGILPTPRHWSGVSQANMAMGQGVAVTALQLAMAYGAVANNGWLLRPILITSTQEPDGTYTRTQPVRVRRVMMPSSARILRKLMVEAVEDGTGGNAIIAGVSVAGKTGTAQKPDPINGGYMSGQHFVSSFCGFLPAENPEWLALVVIDDPQGDRYYGGSVAGPVFRKIMQRLLVTLPQSEQMFALDEYDDPRALSDGRVLAPNVLAFSPDEAGEKLDDCGLKTELVGVGDIVIAQNHHAGSMLNVGDSMELTLGAYVDSGTLTVPELRQKNLRLALAELTSRGLLPAVEGAGVVVRQDPSAGTVVPMGTRVNLIAEPILEATQ